MSSPYPVVRTPPARHHRVSAGAAGDGACRGACSPGRTDFYCFYCVRQPGARCVTPGDMHYVQGFSSFLK